VKNGCGGTTNGKELVMVTERLDGFLSGFCHPDEDPERVRAMLHGPSRAHFMSWLPGDLAAAIRAGDLTPARMNELTSLSFLSQDEVDEWLRKRWGSWFSEPYPG
jgi:hypothetical protein